MPRHLRALTPIALVIALVGVADAQQATDPAAPDQAAPSPAAAPSPGNGPLSPAVVTATRSPRNVLDVPASVDVVTAAQLQDAQLRENLSESLARVPGLVLLNRQNYAQDLQLSIRGFGARSTFGERGVRLYVDGVPANFPDGQGQVSHFPISAADHIEVLRGPFSALYGNSSGGVVALTTDLKPQPVVIDPSFAYGSYSTWRLGFDAKGGAGSNAFNISTERFRTSGYRDHDAAQRDSANIAGLLGDTPLGSLHVFLNAVYMPSAQDAMGLTHAQWQADPRQASPVALQFNSRKSTRQETAGGNLVSNLTADLQLTSSAWIGSRGVTQYQAIPVTTQIAATSPGGVINFDRDFGGVDERLTYTFQDWWTTTGGVDFERMNERRLGFNNFIGAAAAPAELGVEGALRQRLLNTVDSIDPYLQTELKLGSAFIVDAGVRSSHVKIDSADQLRGGGSGTSFSGVEPTAGVVYKLTPATSLYASFGRGFETPTLTELAYRPNGQPGLNTALQAARSNNGEIGLKGIVANAVHYSLAVFAISTRNDLVVATNSGGRSTYSNVGRDRRAGAEAEADWAITPTWSTAISLQSIDAHFSTSYLTCVSAPCATPTLPVAAGNKLPGIPARTLYAELKYHPGWADFSLEGRASSKIYVDDRNTDSAPGYAVMNLSVAKTFAVGSYKPRVFARVDNLFSHEYVGSVIVDESNRRFFEPAATRSYLVGLDWPL